MLDAAYAILAETGLRGFSVEAVAARSNVARTTIYRWWPTKGLLAVESFLEAVESQLVFERTHSPPSDLRELISSLARALSGPAGRIAASVVAEAQHDAAVQEQFVTVFSTPLRRRATEVIQAGIKSGCFRADLDAARILDAAVGAVYLRLLFGLSLDPDWANALSDTLLRGCVG